MTSVTLPAPWNKILKPQTSGAFMFNENGILFPTSAVEKDVFAGMKLYGVDNIESAQINDLVTSYCDGEGAINGKHQANKTFGRLVHGPVFIVASSDKTGNDIAITWKKLSTILARTHHVCGWPLTLEEKRGKPVPMDDDIPKEALTRIVPPEIVSALWTENSTAQYWRPTKVDGKALPIDQVCAEGTYARSGCIVQRRQIPDPREPYPGSLIDVLEITLLTLEGGKQRPMAIGHFLQDGTLVRSQVNCYGMGILTDEGQYFAEYADEVEDEESSEDDGEDDDESSEDDDEDEKSRNKTGKHQT